MIVGAALAGRVRFRDLQYRKDAEFVVQVDTTKDEVILCLDQDVDATGGFYSAECLVGMEAKETQRLISLLEKSVSRLPETGQGPNVIGRVTFKWCDPGAPGSENSGVTVIASSGWVILGIAPGENSIADAFLATFDYKTGEALAATLSRGVSALDTHNRA
jgi:hypothetical protein